MKGLARDLIYTDKCALDAFGLPFGFMEDGLYPLYIETKDNEYNWKNSPLLTFNEIFYQITRVYLDPHPETDIKVNYLNDAYSDMGRRYESDYIFCFVWAILKMQIAVPQRVRYFMIALERYLSQAAMAYFPSFEKWVRDYPGLKSNIDYSPHPDLSKGDYSLTEWEDVTDDFTQETIVRIINQYKSKEEKLLVLNSIECAFYISLESAELPF